MYQVFNIWDYATEKEILKMNQKPPFLLNSDKIVSFDCDDTLVMWPNNPYQYRKDAVRLELGPKKDIVYLYPHLKHIRKLKGHKRSGYKVIIWSMGGYEWALEVATKLELLDHVDLIMSKPIYLYDDMPLNDAFMYRRYYQPRTIKE